MTVRAGWPQISVVHFFDLLIWLFGSVEHSEVHLATQYKTGGYIELEKARVRWFLSIDENDLPDEIAAKGQPTYRSITIDEEEVEFSGGFTDLHTEVYKNILAGKGFGLDDALPSVSLVQSIRKADVTSIKEYAHPLI